MTLSHTDFALETLIASVLADASAPLTLDALRAALDTQLADRHLVWRPTQARIEDVLTSLVDRGHIRETAEGYVRRPIDFTVENHGSVMTLTPHTPEAEAWAEAHLPEDRLFWAANSTVIEPRYWAVIYEGIRAAGFRCQ